MGCRGALPVGGVYTASFPYRFEPTTAQCSTLQLEWRETLVVRMSGGAIHPYQILSALGRHVMQCLAPSRWIVGSRLMAHNKAESL
jgi:hypothetical protein